MVNKHGIKIELPKDVEYIINKIKENKGVAFAVGGCVRDLINGAIPNDWDIGATR